MCRMSLSTAMLCMDGYWASSLDKCRISVDVKMDVHHTKLDKMRNNHIKKS